VIRGPISLLFIAVTFVTIELKNYINIYRGNHKHHQILMQAIKCYWIAWTWVKIEIMMILHEDL